LNRWGIFPVALGVCAAVAIIGIARPDLLVSASSALTGAVFRALDWFYMFAVTALLIASLALALSKYGRLRLGAPNDKPEFSTPSWLAMLFAAGMGVGLIFWGVAEPMIHYAGAPGTEPYTAAAARRAFVLTSFHWGVHAWAVYCMAALVIAYYGYRRGGSHLPGTPILRGFRGRWVAPSAWTADLVGVLAVTFGVAGSVAMGVLQLHTGLNAVGGISIDSAAVLIAILLALVACYTASAATSISKGIKWLSNLNMTLAIVLMLFVLVAGPTAVLLKGFVSGVGDYVTSLLSLSLRLYPYEDHQAWLGSWTLTYFIWWIAWAPFVGVFIARISRGRTIREFVFGVIFAPTLFSLFWFAVFGGTALHEEIHGAGGIASLARENATVALFTLFDRLPLTTILSTIAIMLLFVFLVTSVDSATFVLGMLTSGGSSNPPRRRKLAWGVIVGLLGGALALTRDVAMLRSVAVLWAIPFTFILLVQVVALLRTVRGEGQRDPPAEPSPRKEQKP
jgi:glycine betaine transporter